ncbi:hypothetical protein M433DRAFT_71037 [Acidomyces richmondensis BFW]|nr:MAG: hypothetical protein FE78DRAFT_149209 [Acidomyces sp. 'richmondensis']KYG43717.1 hypothetical protein M433DRAFT_71037 [Acidomyces richmondensis BFW]
MDKATISAEIEASCAICGAPPFPECPHEGKSLELAIDQAQARWTGLQEIRREWVLIHARNQIIQTFHQMRALRYQQHLAYLETLPCFTLYTRWHGNPPIHPSQLQHLNYQIQVANDNFKRGVDEDWRRSCLKYPEVLDYYFGLVEVDFPRETDSVITSPRFGAPLKETRRIRARGGGDGGSKELRKKERRRSRGRTPPTAPMPNW